MKNFLKRKVRIFGRAVPVSVLLLALTAAVALAVFMNIYTATVTVTVLPGPQGTLELMPSGCEVVLGSGSGSGVLTGQDLAVTGTGIDNDTTILCTLRYTADTDQYFYFDPPAPLPAGISEIYTQFPDGEAFNSGAAKQFYVGIRFYDLTAGQVVDPFEIGLQFSE